LLNLPILSKLIIMSCRNGSLRVQHLLRRGRLVGQRSVTVIGSSVRFQSTVTSDPKVEAQDLLDGVMSGDQDESAAMGKFSGQDLADWKEQVTGVSDIARQWVEIPGYVRPEGFTHWLADKGQFVITHIADWTNLPWWAVIIGATVSYRGLILPFAVKNQMMAKRMQAVQPILKLQQEKMKGAKGDVKKTLFAQQEMQALMKKYDVNPLAPLKTAFLTAPVFMTMFFALRDAPLRFPGLSEGGPSFCTDLSVADPTYTIPFVAAALTFVGSEVNIRLGQKYNPMEPTGMTKTIHKVMRFMPVLMFGASTQFAAAIPLYWSVNGVMTTVQALVSHSKPVREKSLEHVKQVNETMVSENEKAQRAEREKLSNVKVTFDKKSRAAPFHNKKNNNRKKHKSARPQKQM